MKLERSHFEQRRVLCGLIGGGAVALGAGAIVPLLEYVADAR